MTKRKKVTVTEEERRQPLTPDLISRRLKLMGMLPMNLRAATGVPESTYLRWGAARQYPAWLYSWLILAEASPNTARQLGSHAKRRPPPPDLAQKLAAARAKHAAARRTQGGGKPNG